MEVPDQSSMEQSPKQNNKFSKLFLPFPPAIILPNCSTFHQRKLPQLSPPPVASIKSEPYTPGEAEVDAFVKAIQRLAEMRNAEDDVFDDE